MDSQTRRREVVRNRQEEQSNPRAAGGSRQICIPMTQQQYEDIWQNSEKVRSFLDALIAQMPECFPEPMRDGYQLSGRLPESRKMPGMRLRQVCVGGVAYTLRPSFVMPYCIGSTDELRNPLLLLAHGVPCWLVTAVCGRNDLFWYRSLQSLESIRCWARRSSTRNSRKSSRQS